MSARHDIGQYYNQTQNHYQRWWQLKKGMALHYGIWEPATKSFLEALENTNQILMTAADIQPGDRVLDAGCGVGGSAIYLAKNKHAHVCGITLSEKQVKTARANAAKHHMESVVEFTIQDYANTSFQDNSFDIVWACESVSSAIDKAAFSNEAFRLLRKGGRLVVSDFVKSEDGTQDHHNLLDTWADTWAMAPLVTSEILVNEIQKGGLKLNLHKDYTAEIYPTAKRMYLGYLLGAFPAKFYNRIFGASRYARNHYRSGYLQYKALKRGLWQYQVMVFSKS